MTTTADTQANGQNLDEYTVVVPRPALPQPPAGYAPYSAPGYGQPYAQYGQQALRPATPRPTDLPASIVPATAEAIARNSRPV